MVGEEEVLDSAIEPGEELEPAEASEESAEVTVAEGEEPTEAATDTTTTDDRPRNPDGTFAKKEPQDGPQATTVAPETPAPQTTTEPAAEPFTFRSNRQEYQLDGAQYIKGEGVFIPEANLQRVQQMLSQAVYFETTWRKQEEDYKRQIEAARTSPELKEKEERANALLAELDAVLSNPEALVAFYENLQTQGPALKERARAKMLEQRLAEIEQSKKSEQSQMEEQQELEDKATAFRETVAELKADPRFKMFTEQDWQDYEQEMADLEPVLFVKLEDGPEGPGTYIDTAKMVKMAERRANILGRVTQQTQTIQKAMDFNKFRTKTTTPTAQPPRQEVVREPEKPKPKSRDEWLRSMGVAY